MARPYESRLQAHSKVPIDVAGLNVDVMGGSIKPEKARTLLLGMEQSWNGVVGGLFGDSPERYHDGYDVVARAFMPIGNTGNEVIGRLQGVTIDDVTVHGHTGKKVQPGQVYQGPAVVVEFADDEGEVAQVLASTPDLSVRGITTTLERRPRPNNIRFY